ncbi:MAG: hypothetical protein Q4F21_08210 [Lachnospiraceae bacterium]|nr:hypothetical protein [Lachnospiraceae bacterium]
MMKMKTTQEPLTSNEAAFLYCILGSADGLGGVIYPTVEESINYFFANTVKKIEQSKQAVKRTAETEPAAEFVQLSLFA